MLNADQYEDDDTDYRAPVLGGRLLSDEANQKVSEFIRQHCDLHEHVDIRLLAIETTQCSPPGGDGSLALGSISFVLWKQIEVVTLSLKEFLALVKDPDAVKHFVIDLMIWLDEASHVAAERLIFYQDHIDYSEKEIFHRYHLCDGFDIAMADMPRRFVEIGDMQNLWLAGGVEAYHKQAFFSIRVEHCQSAHAKVDAHSRLNQSYALVEQIFWHVLEPFNNPPGFSFGPFEDHL